MLPASPRLGIPSTSPLSTVRVARETQSLSPLNLSSSGRLSSGVAFHPYLRPPSSPLASASTSLPSLLAPSPTLQSTPLPSWSPPGPPQPGSTNDRRVARAAAARASGVSTSPFGPMPTIQSRRQQRTVSTRRVTFQPGSTSSAGLSSRSGGSRKYVVVIHTEPAYGTIETDSGADFEILRSPVPQKINDFLAHVQTLGLVLSFECHAKDDEAVAPRVHQELISHFERVGLAFAAPSLSPTLSPSTSMLQPRQQLLPWAFLMTGKGQRKTAFGAKLLPFQRTESVTYKELTKNAGRLPALSSPYEKYSLVFILPTRNIVTGPLHGQGTHYCLAKHIWNGFITADLNEGQHVIECTSSCHINEHEIPDVLSPSAHSQVLTFLDVLAAAEAATFPTPAATSLPTTEEPTSTPHRPGPTQCPQRNLTAQPNVPAPEPSTLPLVLQPVLPVCQRGISLALGAWHDRINGAISTAASAFTREDIHIDIQANSAADAAKGFLALCTSFHNCNPTTLNFNNVTITIGDGVGDGPLRSFWAALMVLITEDSGHWHGVGEDGYYVPVVTSLPPSEEELRSFRAYGMIMRTGLIWGMELLPISPAIILLIIAGYQAAIESTFLEAVAPFTSRRLSSWPPPTVHDSVTGVPRMQISQGCDPYTMILEVDGTIQLRTLASTAQLELGQRLTSFMVFKTQAAQLEPLHSIYSAMALAFRECLYGERQFSQASLFYPGTSDSQMSPADILVGMFGDRTVNSVQQIIGLLTPYPLPSLLPSTPGFDPQLDYPRLAAKWMQHLKRYLRGTGVPRNHDGSLLFDERENDDPLFRAKLFLRCVSASSFLPIDPMQKIRIKFTLQTTHRWGTVVGLQIHTCFFTVDALLDNTTATIIDQDIPDDIFISTDFDRWIHSIIGDTTYNTL
ncbi:hypothetical protein BU15DRAFT_76230 [Melanogaster broomeanus]|nr:hypothetical protein BU15DRAFT_76230 [Melanogaster broomeanus]